MDWEETKKQLTDTEAMVLTVYGEARGEPVEGQLAVINVIFNRSRFRKISIKEACFQVRQFSCWNKDDPQFSMLKEMAERTVMHRLPNETIIDQISYLVTGVILRQLRDNTRGADHYMTTLLYESVDRPNWAQHPKVKPLRIGNHTFLQV